MQRGRKRQEDPPILHAPSEADVTRAAWFFEIRGTSILMNREPQLVFNGASLEDSDLPWYRDRFGGRIVPAGMKIRWVLREEGLLRFLERIEPFVEMPRAKDRIKELRLRTLAFMNVIRGVAFDVSRETDVLKLEDGEDVLSLPDPFDVDFIDVLRTLLEERRRVVVQFRRKGSENAYCDAAQAAGLTAQAVGMFLVFTMSVPQVQDVGEHAR